MRAFGSGSLTRLVFSGFAPLARSSFRLSRRPRHTHAVWCSEDIGAVYTPACCGQCFNTRVQGVV